MSEVELKSDIHTRITGDGKCVIIRMASRFDFGVHKKFREAYRLQNNASFEVDLSHTEYMDSSALGMLLLLREHAGGDKAKITLRNPNQTVGKILRIANFDKLFEITGICE